MNVNDADEIIPRLWLGNVNASKDTNFIRQKNIQVVFNCTKNLEFSPNIPIKYRIPLDDNLEEDEIRNMELWSNEIAFKIIAEYNTGKSILVHCMAGMQRSAAAVAIFLIAYQRIKAAEAIQFIKHRRPIAFFKNANFGRSIEYFDKKFYNEILPIIQDNQDIKK
jgi:protein-tyrosine phosphatase